MIFSTFYRPPYFPIDSDSEKIIAVNNLFDEIYRANFERFLEDKEFYRFGYRIIKKLSEDLSEPLPNDILEQAEDLFDHSHDAAVEYLDENEKVYPILEGWYSSDEPYYRSFSSVQWIEKDFDKFFNDLYEEATKRE